MRAIAVALALLAFVATLPAIQAGDDCSTNATAVRACLKVEVPQPDGRVPTGATYYVWASPVACVNPLSHACRGTPAGDGSTLGVFNVVYKETNSLPGLQRAGIIDGRYFPPDAMLVI